MLKITLSALLTIAQLAIAKDDPGRTAAALAATAGAYEKAGRYDLAAAQAQRALQLDPHNEEARGVYMFSKDRATAKPNDGSPSTRRVESPARPFPTTTPAPLRLDRTLIPADRPQRNPSIERASAYYSARCLSGDRYACEANAISTICFDSSPKNNCVRDCLVDRDAACAGASGSKACRWRAHFRCYFSCRKFIPSPAESLCWRKIWNSF